MMIRLLNIGVKSDEKIYMMTDFFFLPLHMYRMHLSPPVWKTYPTPNLPLTGQNNYHLFNQTDSAFTQHNNDAVCYSSLH